MSEALKPSGKKKVIPKEKLKAFERNLEREKEVHHDLFRLDDAVTLKNISFNEDHPNWERVPHRHYFHTVTSDGKKQETSAPSSGHYHHVKVEENDAGEIVSVECGPPMVMHMGKSHPYKNDNHTHELSYISSEKVMRRVSNAEAVKVMTAAKSEEIAADNGVRGIIK